MKLGKAMTQGFRGGAVRAFGCYASSAMLRGALVTTQRAVHERPFTELPADPARGEAYEVARDALLQLNIMTRRGIEPDALMYTSLISIMGRAGLEWQAYKLFSRMIEGNVRPLPETYVALRDATARHRTKLREEIQTKIEESTSTFPDEIAQEELTRQREEDRECVAKFEDYMRGELPPPPPPLTSSTGTPSESSKAEGGEAAQAQNGESSSEAENAKKPVMTMKIRNPTDAWSTAQYAEEIRGQPQHMAQGSSAASLREALEKMHEEELRIYLASNRQLRHGNKAALVDRVLANIGEHAIRAMLDRRAHYFRSVEQILAADLEVVKAAPPLSKEEQEANNRHMGERDRTLTKEETEQTSPEVLLTPWGIIRKPLRYREDRSMSAYHSLQLTKGNAAKDEEAGEGDSGSSPSSETMARLERVHLTAPELFLIRHKAETGDLDELPESFLRRYAYQFRLRWRRRQPLSLLEAVSWHATTFLVPNAKDSVEEEADARSMIRTPSPTPPIRLQKEKEGMQKTLENFEAFRIISQRTNNLQVVDDKEINLHLKRIRRDAVRQERKTEEGLRRESNILAAAGLAASAKSYTPPPGDEWEGAGGSHVLGWGEHVPSNGSLPSDADETQSLEGSPGHPNGAIDVADDDDEAEMGGKLSQGETEQTRALPDELPPWELASGEEEFNLSTGRFGDPDVGHYQELSDSTIRVLPSRAAQKQWSVDRHLLPGNLKDVVARAELEQLQYRETVEEEYRRRRQYAKYRKWDNMIQRAAKRKEAAELGVSGEGDDDSARVRPLPAKKRLAQLLRRGAEKQKVPASVKEKFNRSL